MYHEIPRIWKDLLKNGLNEDGWPWDWTTLGTQLETQVSIKKSKRQKLQARVIGKSEGIWAAETLVLALNEVTKNIHAQSRLSDDKKFKKDDVIVSLQGSADEILALERPFLNLAAYCSGIATATARLVEKVKKACPTQTPRVTLTRKTLPYYRDISIHSVRVGGGYPHRVSLAGGILIKENHIAAAGNILKAVEGVRAVAPHGLKIEVEVRNQSELRQAVNAGAEGVLLDNFSPEQVSTAVRFLSRLNNRPFVEVSGGLTLSNISSYAMMGVDILSVGSLTHSVQAVDLSLLIYE